LFCGGSHNLVVISGFPLLMPACRCQGEERNGNDEKGSEEAGKEIQCKAGEEIQRKKVQPQGVILRRARDEGDEAGQAQVGTQREEGHQPQAGNRDRLVGGAQGGREGSIQEDVCQEGSGHGNCSEKDGGEEDICKKEVCEEVFEKMSE
jgi:hypothetical protein